MPGFDYTMSERQCDFVGALAAMHELVGSVVGVWVLGTCSDIRRPTLALSGRVERGMDLGSRGDDPVAFEIGGMLLRLSERTLQTAWRCEYAGGGAQWLAVDLRFRGGLEVEIDQLPDPGALSFLEPLHDE